MGKLLLGCSTMMLTIAAAPPPSAPQLAQNSPASPVVEQVMNGTDSVRPAGGGTAAAPAEKKVCKLLDSSYSHRSERVCLTAKEWQQVDEQMR